MDNFVVGGNMPGIVGNCPDNSGHPRPVYWSAAVLGGYMATALNLPLNAVFCRAKTVVNTRIMGYCDFGAQGGRTVVWLNSSSSPQVLSISSPPARNSGVDLNILGEVIGHYQLADGRSMPYYWNSQTGVIRDIPPLPGGMNARVVDIGDNGTVAGHSELADGSSHAITWTPWAAPWTREPRRRREQCGLGTEPGWLLHDRKERSRAIGHACLRAEPVHAMKAQPRLTPCIKEIP
ncbi:hypothetical protein ACHFCA_13525 [Delftia tsuruhatensis]